MEPHSENRLTLAGPGGEGAPATALVSPIGEGAPGAESHAARLDQLGMQLDVMVRVPGFRVRDLLALETGRVVETEHEHTQDVPIECGGMLLMWGEFEVLDERLAVRITRLA